MVSLASSAVMLMPVMSDSLAARSRADAMVICLSLFCVCNEPGPNARDGLSWLFLYAAAIFESVDVCIIEVTACILDAESIF